MNEQDWTLINAWFDGQLSDSDRQAAEQRAATDPAFADGVALRRQMDGWLKAQPGREALHQTLQGLGDEFFTSTTAATPLPDPVLKISFARRWMAVAATLIVLCVAAWWLLRPTASLYEQYAMHAPLQLTQRGNTQALVTAAESAFRQKNYTEAASNLRQLLDQQTDNNTARLYLGICQIEINQTSDALNTLAPLAQGNTALRADAIWYSALAHIKAGNQAAARDFLNQINSGDEHAQQARELLEKMK